ncbi:MAG: hypothetical protein R3C18_27940 [Planctomycetaceae bacterium]
MLRDDVILLAREMFPEGDAAAFENFQASLLSAYGLGEPILSAMSYGYGDCGCADGDTSCPSQSGDGSPTKWTTKTYHVTQDGWINSSALYDNTTFIRLNDGAYFRFDGVDIPQGATVVNAYLTVRGLSTASDSRFLVSVACEDADDATEPTDRADFLARDRTSHTIEWAYTPAMLETSTEREFPNMACSLNAVINRENWSSGNAVTVFVDALATEAGSGEYPAVESLEGDFDLAADLTVVYSMYPVRWVEFEVLASADDGLWSSGVFQNNINTLPIGGNVGGHTCFIRLDTVNVPRLADIGHASLMLNAVSTVDNGLGPSTSWYWRYEDADDPTQIADESDANSRTLSTTYIPQPEAVVWNDVCFESVDLTELLSEIVARAGWNCGQAMQFFDTNQTTDTYLHFESYDSTASPASPPRLIVAYIDPETTGAGVVAGGGALVDVPLTGSGGVVLGGQSSVSTTMTEQSSGGVLIGGEWVPVVVTHQFAEGGVMLGGTPLIWGVQNITTSGGAVICQPLFPNGFESRTLVTVPAGSVTEDMAFYLGVRLTLPDTSGTFLVTDMEGHTLSHEVRQTTETTAVLFFRCDLKADVDNQFYVYSGGEE